MTYPAVYGATYTTPHAVSSRLSWLGIARELVTGMPAAPTAAVPVDTDGYELEDTPGFLLDTGLRASSGSAAGIITGTLDSAFSFGAPFYADTGGFWLDNLLGDVSTVATLSGGGSPGAVLAQPVNAGDTVLYTSASIGSVSTGSVVQIGDGPASEVVTATAGSSSTVIRFAGTPCRFAHSTAATATLLSSVAYYTHTFSALNSGTGEPPTHTLTDTSGLTAGTSARVYPAAALAQLDLAGDPGKGFITAKLTGASWLSQPATVTPVNPGWSGVTAFPGWFSVVTAGSAPAGGPGAWTVSLKRQMVIYRSPGNGQTPFIIARGPLTVTGTLAWPGATDDTALSQMTSGGLLPLQIAAGNGVSGTGALALTITASAAQVMKAKLSRETPSLSYGTAWQATDNATDAGGSGGISPVQVTLTNGTAAY